MKEECKKCNLKQVSALSSLLELDQATKDQLLELTTNYLCEDFADQTNPEVMGELYRRLLNILGHTDPYETIKHQYNELLLQQEPMIEKLITTSPNQFQTALKVAIVGNLIDFSAKHQFSKEMLLAKIEQIVDSQLAIDDSQKLYDHLENSKSLLYLGDNCGEIVLDKIFIKKIKELFPHLEITFACRGFPVVNDATMADVKQVGLDQVCTVIDNGDGSLGTVISRVSDPFKKIFNQADVIISKGQGNLESLMDGCYPNIYFMFMVKCELVGDPLKLNMYDIVCGNLYDRR